MCHRGIGIGIVDMYDAGATTIASVVVSGIRVVGVRASALGDRLLRMHGVVDVSVMVVACLIV